MASKKGYTPKGKLGTGSRFGAVSGQATSEYVKKGYTPKKAAQIGAAIAANAGRSKFGFNKMAKLAKAGRNNE